MKRLCVRDRVMISNDACTCGTSKVLIVALLQWLKMEALISAPADCEAQSVIKFLNTQSITLIKIHDTGLVFGECQVQILVLTKLIWVLFMVSFSHQGKC